MDKQQKTVIIIFAAVLLVALIVLFAVLFGREKEVQILEFEKPPFETNAVLGKPTVEQSLMYREVDVGGSFVFSVCGCPVVENNELILYFSSNENNTPWLLVKIFDTKGNEIGKSGILRAGEYVRSIPLSQIPENGKVKLKIITYEPDTYYSMGTASAEISFSKK